MTETTTGAINKNKYEIRTFLEVKTIDRGRMNNKKNTFPRGRFIDNLPGWTLKFLAPDWAVPERHVW